ncbi:MAG: homocysteine biosynthesis protein [Myxococcota bacterium]|nr:homocysteine biosynthesis protein [Myxococcota bacterium]
MAKTFEEINEKIRQKKAVVVTAEEMIGIVADKGAKGAADQVDVVTTGTFGPMCSSGALLSVGHTTPRMKMQRAWVNDVPAYCGVAAVDLYIGATELAQNDPENKVFPGEFKYGGAHVIEDLVRGADVTLRAEAYGTDCYPRKELETLINLKDMNNAVLLNPRNAYQNYNVAVNATASRPIYTYLGVLRPRLANANYCSAGQLSPLLNDPLYRTIGIGTRIFLGGGVGYVYYHGTQHDPSGPRTDAGVPLGGAGTLAVTGELDGMNADFLRAVSITGYGVSISVGIGVPIPILDEEMAQFTAVKDSDIKAPVVDYAEDYSNNAGKPLAHVTYAELKSGTIEIGDKKIRTASLSSYAKARKIATVLKQWIQNGTFTLGQPVALLPGKESGVSTGLLTHRPANK